MEVEVITFWLNIMRFLKQTIKKLVSETFWKKLHLQLYPLLKQQPLKTNIQTDIFCSCITSGFEHPDTSIVFLKWHVKIKKSLKNMSKPQNFVPFSCILSNCFWTKESVLCTFPKKCVWSGSCEPENSPIIQSNKIFKICIFVHP